MMLGELRQHAARDARRGGGDVRMEMDLLTATCTTPPDDEEKLPRLFGRRGVARGVRAAAGMFVLTSFRAHLLSRVAST